MVKIENIDSIRSLIENVKFKSDKHGDIVLFTNGNLWYIDTLIKNLLKSMEIYEKDRKIAVFCSDTEGLEKCKELGFKYCEYVDIPTLGVKNSLTGTDADTNQYTSLSFVKVVLCKYILDLGYTPLYIDPDMAFKRPGIDNLISYLDSGDFICAGCTSYMNSNILIAKPCKDNLELFDVRPDDVNIVLNDPDKYGDEDFFRPRLHDKKSVYVNQSEYPPGCDAKRFESTAIMIHANCVKGLVNKINLLKECNAWFLYTGLLSSEFVVGVKDIYPPFLEGDLFEVYFANYVATHNPPLKRMYINATWTNLYCNAQFKGIPFDNYKLQMEVDNLSKDGKCFQPSAENGFRDRKYFTVVQFDEGVKHNRLPPDTLVFGCCEGNIPIPLTYESKFFDSIIPKKWSEKTIFCSFIGGYTHTVRRQLTECVEKLADYYIYVTKQGEIYNKDLYVEKSMNSKFCLAPRGFGRSSFRFFEVLKLGSIPVYIWDDKDWLPFKHIIDYSMMCVTINISELENLDSILRKITEEQYENMISYYQRMKHLFTYKGMCEEIINLI